MMPHEEGAQGGRGEWSRAERRVLVRYAVLTLALCGPLLWAFAAMRNLYPLTASTMMMAGGDLGRGHTYFILRGETASGEVVEVRPAALTGALYGRTWGMVGATVRNDNFRLPSPHPDNAALAARAGGVENLPSGARVPELLRAWGEIYNADLPPASPRRLTAVRLDAYRWEGGRYADYEQPIESWREQL